MDYPVSLSKVFLITQTVTKASNGKSTQQQRLLHVRRLFSDYGALGRKGVSLESFRVKSSWEDQTNNYINLGLRRQLSSEGKDNDILPAIFSVPVLRNHRFSGREHQLKQLEEAAGLRSHTLENGHSYPVTAVYGLGGIG